LKASPSSPSVVSDAALCVVSDAVVVLWSVVEGVSGSSPAAVDVVALDVSSEAADSSSLSLDAFSSLVELELTSAAGVAKLLFLRRRRCDKIS
jgi:hypothetical protein